MPVFILIGLLVVSIALVLLGFALKRLLMFDWFNLIHSSSFLLLIALLGYSIQISRNTSKYTGENNTQNILLKIESVKESFDRLKIEGEVITFKETSSETSKIKRLLVHLPIDSIVEKACYGDLLWLRGKPVEIEEGSIPSSFNRKKFYRNKGINHQLYLNSRAEYLHIVDGGFSLIRYAGSLREEGKKILQNVLSDSLSSSIASALILGDKSEVEYKTKSLFATAGLSHVLAVSGLHLGIIYLMLRFFLLQILNIRNSFIRYSIIVVSIWSYAILTGLSPSVTRAAFMLMLFDLKGCLKRNASAYNLLACSAFFILCFNPGLIMNLGFQLSYAAVLGILSIHPILILIGPRSNFLAHYIWSLMAVSISAQLMTFPLTVFYFNQFPVYFLLTNIIVVPFISVFMILSLLTLALASVPVIGQVVSFILKYLINVLHDLLSFVSHLPHASLKFYINELTVIFLYFFLVVLLVWLHSGRKTYFFVALIISSLYIGYKTNLSKYASDDIQLYAFSEKGRAFLGLVGNGSHRLIPFDGDGGEGNIPKSLDFFYKSRGIEKPQLTSLSDSSSAVALNFSGKKILLIYDHLELDSLEGRFNIVMTNNREVCRSYIDNNLRAEKLIVLYKTFGRNDELFLNLIKNKNVIYLPYKGLIKIDLNSFEE